MLSSCEISLRSSKHAKRPVTNLSDVSRRSFCHQHSAPACDLTHERLRTFIPDTGVYPPGMAQPRTAWVWLNCLRTHSCLLKWGMRLVPSAACERGAEEQTVDHVVLHCPIRSHSHGQHGLAVLDNETIDNCVTIGRDICVTIGRESSVHSGFGNSVFLIRIVRFWCFQKWFGRRCFVWPFDLF